MENFWHRSRQCLLEHVGCAEQLAGIRRSSLLEGKARSVEIIDVYTGSGFNFTVVVDRALDVSDVSFCGKSLCWKSNAGIVSSPYYEREGSGWLRGFGGGMLVTCGLRNVGPALREGWESYGLHGEISYLPATQVNTTSAWTESGYQLSVSGLIKEAYPFGPNLRLYRTWKTQMGANWLEIEDRVTNEGFRPEIHMQLYHWNFGFPFLNSKTRIYASTDAVSGRDEVAQRAIANWSRFEPPTQDFAEQVFFHSYSSHVPPETSILLISDEDQPALAAEITYPSSQLPYLTQWKLCGKGEYVLGIEPGNCLLQGRGWNRSQEFLQLEPAQSRDFRLRFAILDTEEAVMTALQKYHRSGSYK